jgi:hypothetical protein
MGKATIGTLHIQDYLLRNIMDSDNSLVFSNFRRGQGLCNFRAKYGIKGVYKNKDKV